MADTFDLPTEMSGRETTFPAQVMRYGYTHKVHVMFNGVLAVFEPDEEQRYRAIVDPATSLNINNALLEEINNTLQFLLGD